MNEPWLEDDIVFTMELITWIRSLLFNCAN